MNKNIENAKRFAILGIFFLILGFILYIYGSNEQSSYYYELIQQGKNMALFGIIILIFGFIFITIGFVFISINTNKKEIKSESSNEILNKRYAKGELTKEQYEQMKKDLEG